MSRANDVAAGIGGLLLVVGVLSVAASIVGLYLRWWSDGPHEWHEIAFVLGLPVILIGGGIFAAAAGTSPKEPKP